jgi:hypothetical protein
MAAHPRNVQRAELSLPHPDGNATGFTNLEPTVSRDRPSYDPDADAKAKRRRVMRAKIGKELTALYEVPLDLSPELRALLMQLNQNGEEVPHRTTGHAPSRIRQCVLRCWWCVWWRTTANRIHGDG